MMTIGCPSQVVSLERRQASTPMAVTGGFDNTDLDAGTGSSATSANRRTREGWEWTLGSVRREHTHDVYALAIHEQSLEGRAEEGGAGAARKGPVLVSGGVDASLSLYSVPGFKTQASGFRFCRTSYNKRSLARFAAYRRRGLTAALLSLGAHCTGRGRS